MNWTDTLKLYSMNSDPFLTLSFFEGLTEAQRKVLRPIFVPVEFEESVVIFEQGAPAEYLHIVAQGEVVVMFKPDDGPHLPVARVCAGGVVGWSAAVGSRKYTSAAITTQYTYLLRVRGSELRSLFRQHPDIGKIMKERLASVIAERARSTHAQVMNLLDMGLSSPTEEPLEVKPV